MQHPFTEQFLVLLPKLSLELYLISVGKDLGDGFIFFPNLRWGYTYINSSRSLMVHSQLFLPNLYTIPKNAKEIGKMDWKHLPGKKKKRLHLWTNIFWWRIAKSETYCPATTIFSMQLLFCFSSPKKLASNNALYTSRERAKLIYKAAVKIQTLIK